jgi:hypothetical protein
MSKKIIVTVSCIVFGLSLLTVPVEKIIGYQTTFWAKSIATLILVTISFILKNFKYKYWLLTAAIVVACTSRPISDFIFLGKRLGYLYHGEDAGFIEVFIFPRDQCRITYGGISGIRQMYYGTYRLTDSTVLIRSYRKNPGFTPNRIVLGKESYYIRNE